MSFDNVPYIGYINKREDNIYVATGFSKWGITNGTACWNNNKRFNNK